MTEIFKFLSVSSMCPGVSSPCRKVYNQGHATWHVRHRVPACLAVTVCPTMSDTGYSIKLSCPCYRAHYSNRQRRNQKNSIIYIFLNHLWILTQHTRCASAIIKRIIGFSPSQRRKNQLGIVLLITIILFEMYYLYI